MPKNATLKQLEADLQKAIPEEFVIGTFPCWFEEWMSGWMVFMFVTGRLACVFSV